MASTRSTTLAVKVSRAFARKYRDYCDVHALQVGKFTEQALSEVMEDFHFGMKAQRVLSTSTGGAVPHAKAFRGRKRKRA